MAFCASLFRRRSGIKPCPEPQKRIAVITAITIFTIITIILLIIITTTIIITTLIIIVILTITAIITRFFEGAYGMGSELQAQSFHRKLKDSPGSPRHTDTIGALLNRVVGIPFKGSFNGAYIRFTIRDIIRI